MFKRNGEDISEGRDAMEEFTNRIWQDEFCSFSLNRI